MVKILKTIHRRGAIGLGAAFAGVSTIGRTADAATAQAAPSQAAPSLSKAAVGYQDIPNNGRVCAQCVFFLFKPATGNGPSSRCQMVAGPISPAGWCEIWAPHS